MTNALMDQFTGSPVFGLQELLDTTYEVIPEVVEGALTAAQVALDTHNAASFWNKARSRPRAVR